MPSFDSAQFPFVGLDSLPQSCGLSLPTFTQERIGTMATNDRPLPRRLPATHSTLGSAALAGLAVKTTPTGIASASAQPADWFTRREPMSARAGPCA